MSTINKTCFIVFVAVSCLVASGKEIAANQSDNQTVDNEQAAYSSIAPPFITPGKDLFVTREGDAFVATVTATCFLEDDSETQFELLPSAPAFVHVSDAYRRENRTNGYSEAIGVVYITPERGDAGKYWVNLQVKACSGKVERVITFKVHVKKSPQD